jgi:cation diffusion facilitator family transporter
MTASHKAGHAGEGAAISGVIAGLVDTVVTVGAMIAASSSVLLADSLKTFLEFLAVLLSWMALRRIRGSQSTFDYGLHKLEDLSSMLVAVLMLGCLAVIVVNATVNLLHPSHIGGAGVWVSVAAQVVYAFINTTLWRKNQRLAKAQGSPVMQSQARLFFTKAIANVFILGSLLSSMALADYSWSVYIDPIASLAIAGSILIPAAGIFSHSLYDLLDRTLEESDKLTIIGELGQFVHEFTDLHDIRSRRAGSVVFIDIVLEFDADRRVGEVQDVIAKIRRRIEQAIPSSRVTIGLGGAIAPHAEPATANA